jgi:hypothetical protein
VKAPRFSTSNPPTDGFAVANIAASAAFLLPSSSFSSHCACACGIHKRAEIRSDQKRKNSKTGVIGMTAIIAGKIMNLSIETKVAIAVATGFVVVIVGAMAQG